METFGSSRPVPRNLRRPCRFYGTPMPSVDNIDQIKAPTLAICAELDRNLTTQMAPFMTAMLQKQETLD